MTMMRSAVLVSLMALLTPASVFAELAVLHSGGFAGPYRELLPTFEKASGQTVTSTLGASQGNGPATIPALLRKGVAADVVILSNEGLDPLIREGRIVAGSVVNLAQSPLGVAVRAGAPKPDISTVDGFKAAVLRATSVNYVSTSAVYLNEKLFPSLGILEQASRKQNQDNSADLPKSGVDLIIRPVSEIIHLPGFDFVGPVPAQIQFQSIFSAAIVSGSKRQDDARRLIEVMASPDALAIARTFGMEPVLAK